MAWPPQSSPGKVVLVLLVLSSWITCLAFGIMMVTASHPGKPLMAKLDVPGEANEAVLSLHGWYLCTGPAPRSCKPCVSSSRSSSSNRHSGYDYRRQQHQLTPKNDLNHEHHTANDGAASPLLVANSDEDIIRGADASTGEIINTSCADDCGIRLRWSKECYPATRYGRSRLQNATYDFSCVDERASSFGRSVYLAGWMATGTSIAIFALMCLILNCKDRDCAMIGPYIFGPCWAILQLVSGVFAAIAFRDTLLFDRDDCNDFLYGERGLLKTNNVEVARAGSITLVIFAFINGSAMLVYFLQACISHCLQRRENQRESEEAKRAAQSRNFNSGDTSRRNTGSYPRKAAAELPQIPDYSRQGSEIVIERGFSLTFEDDDTYHSSNEPIQARPSTKRSEFADAHQLTQVALPGTVRDGNSVATSPTLATHRRDYLTPLAYGSMVTVVRVLKEDSTWVDVCLVRPAQVEVHRTSWLGPSSVLPPPPSVATAARSGTQLPPPPRYDDGNSRSEAEKEGWVCFELRKKGVTFRRLDNAEQFSLMGQPPFLLQIPTGSVLISYMNGQKVEAEVQL